MVAPPAGLIFRTADGLWRIGPGGRFHRLSIHADAVPSPDFAQIAYVQAGDIFVADLASGRARNVTNTADRIECCPVWWPGKSDLILFGSWPSDYERWDIPFGSFEYGYLTAAKTDGSTYEILDEEQIFYTYLQPAPYKDVLLYGEGISTERGDFQQRLYRQVGGAAPLSLTALEIFPADKRLEEDGLQAPAWAPRGNLLAGFVYRSGLPGSNLYEGLVVADLEAQTVRHLYEYVVFGTDTHPARPVWSPDGTTIAFFAREDNLSKTGLRVMEIESGRTLFAPETDGSLYCWPVILWRPDSRLLACGASVDGAYRHLLVDLTTKTVSAIELPEASLLVAWQ
jgi:Tol biopolymer transport system component